MKVRFNGRRYGIKNLWLLILLLIATVSMIVFIISSIINTTEAHDAEAMSYCMEHYNNYNYCFKGLYGFTPRS